MFRRKPKAPDTPPEWVIVGLGNPGPEYRGTRHNVGFEAIDLIAEKYKIDMKTRQHQAIIGRGVVDGVSAVLVKPMTYMNLSGRAVGPILRQFGLKADRLIVVTDDLDLKPGDLKYKPKGGAGGHNGHKSLIQTLGTDEYARLKVGIGKPPAEGADHVLERFPPDERAAVNDALQRAVVAIETTLTQGLERGIAETNTGRGGSD